MNFSRRTLLGWFSSGLCLAIFGRAHAQEQPQTASPPKSGESKLAGAMGPYGAIENAALAMKPGDADSVRAVTEAIFAGPLVYPIPPIMAAVVKQRLTDAQMAYLNGKTAGTPESGVVDALNGVAAQLQMPDYGMVSLLQVQLTRMSFGLVMPVFMRSPAGPDIEPGQANPPMSPLQAIVTMASLINQKLLAPDYQVPPAEWDRDKYPVLLQRLRAAQDLRRRIAAGETPPKTSARLEARTIGPENLQIILRQRIAALSVADGLKLFNDTFARLSI